jgi:hypothetical protein
LLICGNNFIIPSNASSSRPFSAVVLNFVGSALETTLPVKRQRKKKRMADELVNDERDSSDPLADFRVNVFNLIIDRIDNGAVVSNI